MKVTRAEWLAVLDSRTKGKRWRAAALRIKRWTYRRIAEELNCSISHARRLAHAGGRLYGKAIAEEHWHGVSPRPDPDHREDFRLQ